jgi:predicted O-linked N-acetylglucosamine transferase (SPINDLY family)
VTVEETYRQAMRMHQAGRLGETERMLRQVLAAKPNHAEALHHLGLLENQKGHADLAVELIRKAIAAGPGIADFHINLGLILSAQGRFKEAAASYQQGIQLKPSSADAHFHLATALSHLDRFEEAVPVYRKALELKPDYVDCLANFAIALSELGKFDESLEVGRKAVALRPDFAEAHYNMGNVLTSLRRGAEGLAAFGQALRYAPGFAEAHNGMGALLIDMGRPEEAELSIRRALGIRPDFPEGLNNLGNALLAQGKAAEALAVYGHAGKLQPGSHVVYYNAGNALRELGQTERSIAAFRQALTIKPDDAKSLDGLGLTLWIAKRPDDAINAFREAIALDPKYVDALVNLGNTFNMLNRFGEAREVLERAVTINPKSAPAQNSLAIVVTNMGHLQEGIEAYRRSIDLDPRNALIHCNLVFGLQYLHGNDGTLSLMEARQWDSTHAAPLRKRIAPHANSRDPDRRLRIGYVSNDFREHSVSRFLRPLFQNHNHANFEIVCYSDARHPDSTTEALRACADQWHQTTILSDGPLAEMIRGHGIDILVELMGYTARNRLLVFARKPAPVQISWLGYAGTTGLEAIDYRLTDGWADPPGMTEAFYSEKLLRLPKTNWCFAPPTDLPDVAPTPVSTGRSFCFGSFNKAAKATPMVLDMWAEILKGIAGSRLLLKDRALADAAICERIRADFEQRGIGPERLELAGHEDDLASHFRKYGDVDIALDTFPYHGTTTTCEALWMGVPVITLAGKTHLARVGVSLLTNMGLTELIADSQEKYVAIATGLARDHTRLRELRAGMRARMQTSPLMDGRQFARDVEGAYRDVWRRWCAES